jgi:hypothetical protein
MQGSQLQDYHIYINRTANRDSLSVFGAACFICNKVCELKGTAYFEEDRYGNIYKVFAKIKDSDIEKISELRHPKYISGVKKI